MRRVCKYSNENELGTILLKYTLSLNTHVPIIIIPIIRQNTRLSMHNTLWRPLYTTSVNFIEVRIQELDLPK